MRPLSALPRSFPLVGLLVVSCLGAGCDRARPVAHAGGSETVRPDDLVVRRGPFERRLLLTGEVDAVSALDLKVPRVRGGTVALRSLAPEGAEVKAGDIVVELDPTSLVQELKEKSLQLAQAEIDLERQISQNGVLEADKALDVERKRAVVRRAEVDADVPPGILPKRDYLEKQLALRRARVDLEKAEEALVAQRQASETDVRVKRLALEKLRRSVKAAEDAISTLTLRATGPGTVLLGDHWEGRKFQEGDTVYMGMAVARVTASRARRVQAWLVDVDDGKVEPGMPVRVTLDAHPQQSFTGKIKDVAPVARTAPERRAQRPVFVVGVELGDSESDILRPGLSARVEVIATQHDKALLVPREAVDFREATPRVHRDGGDPVEVGLGGCNAEVCVVTAGLDEGERVRRVPL